MHFYFQITCYKYHNVKLEITIYWLSMTYIPPLLSNTGLNKFNDPGLNNYKDR